MKLFFISILFGIIPFFNQQDKIPVSCEEISIKCTQIKDGNYFINSQNEFEDKLQIKSTHPICVNYELPKIDFGKYSLLGFVASTGGCEEPTIKYFVTNNNLLNISEFNIEINEIGECLRNNIVTVWCLVPKINNEVKFNVNYIYTK